MTTPNAYEKVENRRAELLAEHDKKALALKERIADLQKQVRDLVVEAGNHDQKQNTRLASDARARVPAIQAEITQLVNRDRAMPKDREVIGQYQTSELAAMMRAAGTRAQTMKDDQAMREIKDLSDARVAFLDHLKKIATPETRRLAMAVAQASEVVGLAFTDYAVEALTEPESPRVMTDAMREELACLRATVVIGERAA